MARVTDQNIPSELKDAYGLVLQPETDQKAGQPPKYVKARDPFQLPKMRGLAGPHIGKDQTKQRQKFRDGVDRWHELTYNDHKRWAQHTPEWKSVLHYWNYFILEYILGGDLPWTAYMLHNIQHVTGSCPTSGGLILNISTVDPAKSVVMLWGASYNHHPDEAIGWAWSVYPYLVWLHTTQVRVDWSIAPTVAGNIAVSVIEYI